MSLRLLAFITALFLSSLSFAQVTLQLPIAGTYSRGEGFLFNDQLTNVTTIYGGVAGTCNGDGSSTCNSCAEIAPGTDPVPTCNDSRVYDSLQFGININYEDSTTTNFGPVIATTNLDSNNNQQLVAKAVGLGDISPGSSVVVRFLWSDICNNLLGSTTGCSGASNTAQIIRIGVDVNRNDLLDGDEAFSSDLRFQALDLAGGETSLCKATGASDNGGACNFIAIPGDSKVFMEAVRADCSFPSSTGSEVEQVRVFYQEASLGAPNQLVSTFADMTINDSSTNECNNNTGRILGLSNNEVNGLTNGTTYRFSVGVIDKAGNIGLVTQHPTTASTADCFTGDGSESEGLICHQATPEEVIGLIEDEFDCFITTATYGSPFQPKVKTFRKFRNQFLKTNLLGRAIIHTYYKYSPPIAHWIRNHPQSKSFVRFLLWPLWALAFVCLNHTLAFVLSLVALLVFINRKKFFKGVI